jgi:hypothetical protein
MRSGCCLLECRLLGLLPGLLICYGRPLPLLCCCAAVLPLLCCYALALQALAVTPTDRTRRPFDPCRNSAFHHQSRSDSQSKLGSNPKIQDAVGTDFRHIFSQGAFQVLPPPKFFSIRRSYQFRSGKERLYREKLKSAALIFANKYFLQLLSRKSSPPFHCSAVLLILPSVLRCEPPFRFDGGYGG